MDPLASIYDALDAGEPARARDLARRALVEEAEDPVLHYLAGVAALELGRHEEAAQAFEASAARDPEDPDVLADLGLARFLVLDFEGARDAVARAIDADPRSADAWWTRGLLRERDAEWAEADAAFAKAVTIDAERFAAPFRPTDHAFREALDRAVERLPERQRRHLRESPSAIEPVPGEAWLREMEGAVDPTCFGIETDGRWTLFRRNLERDAEDHEDLIERLVETFRHADTAD